MVKFHQVAISEDRENNGAPNIGSEESQPSGMLLSKTFNIVYIIISSLKSKNVITLLIIILVSSFHVKSGVPQGSIIGPLLYTYLHFIKIMLQFPWSYSRFSS